MQSDASAADAIVVPQYSRSLVFTSYTPRYLPVAERRSEVARNTLLDYVVGTSEHEGTNEVTATIDQWKKMEALGYKLLSAPSGAQWWDGLTSASGAAEGGPKTAGAPPANDYNRLLGLNRGDSS